MRAADRTSRRRAGPGWIGAQIQYGPCRQRRLIQHDLAVIRRLADIGDGDDEGTPTVRRATPYIRALGDFEVGLAAAAGPVPATLRTDRQLGREGWVGWIDGQELFQRLIVRSGFARAPDLDVADMARSEERRV